jgi:hypothetical protein
VVGGGGRARGSYISLLDEDVGSVFDKILHHADELGLVVDLFDGSLKGIALRLPRVRDREGGREGGQGSGKRDPIDGIGVGSPVQEILHHGEVVKLGSEEQWRHHFLCYGVRRRDREREEEGATVV